MRVVYPSTPASYFHLLRWQGRDSIEKPLVVFTPKSLLRNPRCVSTLPELASGRFEPVLDDPGADPARTRRVVLCTGKVYFDLLEAREEWGHRDVALVRLEQLYPLPAPAAAGGPGALLPVGGAGLGARRSRATWGPGASCGRASSTAWSTSGAAACATSAARPPPPPARARSGSTSPSRRR